MTQPPATDPITLGGYVLHNVHPETACADDPACIIHKPSGHHMRDWTLHRRFDRGLWERICPDHGTGHPDPDDLAWHKREGRDWQANHGCDGCCHPPEAADQ